MNLGVIGVHPNDGASELPFEIGERRIHAGQHQCTYSVLLRLLQFKKRLLHSLDPIAIRLKLKIGVVLRNGLLLLL